MYYIFDEIQQRGLQDIHTHPGHQINPSAENERAIF